MLMLEDPYTALLNTPSQYCSFRDPSIPVAEGIAHNAEKIATAFLAMAGPGPCEVASPFILHLYYTSQTIYMEKARHTGDESAFQSAEVLVTVLQVMDGRWKAAGEPSF
jgi:hypothetical protein